MFRSRLLAGLAAAVLALASPSPTAAQSDPLAGATRSAFERDRNVSVRERPKPELDPIGIRAGAFLLYPEAEIGYSWSDNVFATEADEESDASLIARAAARLASQWSRHALNVGATATTRNGDEFGAQDGTDRAIGADARLDIRRSAFVTADVRHSVEQQSRVDFAPRDVLAEPVEVAILSGGVGGVVTFNRLRTAARIETADLDYENARARDGALLQQDDRDRRTLAADARAEYAVTPDTAAFVSLGWRKQDYDLEAPAAAFDRDSDGWRALAGADFDLTRLVRGRIGLGYQRVAYEDPRLSDADGFSAAGSVEWFVTPVVTVTGEVAREIVESNESEASGIRRTALGLRADWEPRRNLLVNVGAAYTDDDYNGIDRTERRWRAEIGAEYQLNRTVALAGAFSRFDQDSEGAFAGDDFQANRLTVSLRLRR